MRKFIVAALVLAAVPAHASPARMIDFAGYKWKVRSGPQPLNPGPNLFSETKDNVWVDEAGRLHLKITRDGSRWRCAEVTLLRSLGYGRYRLRTATKIGALDDRMVFGFFTWDPSPPEEHRELDIELSKWAKPTNDNAQFVVVPTGAKTRFNVDSQRAPTEYTLTWTPGRVVFEGAGVRRWDYANPRVPTAGNAVIQLNLWLFRGQPPVSGREAEIVVDRFEFEPR